MEQDDRFIPTARFKRVPRATRPEADERFSRLFEDDAAPRKGAPKIDPFGRPLGDVSAEDVVSSDSESEDSFESGDVASEAEVDDDTKDLEYGEATNRLAVVGCDWENISASDLFVLFETMYRSLSSKHTSCVKRAAIYLSDFGVERLAYENIHGPPVVAREDVREEELDDTARQEALRKYQKERSRYYYGIVEFENVNQAKLLYDEMDGVEAYFAFASLDLRFVPDHIVFERDPTSECFEMPSNYEPPAESTSAFRHSRVECKWDMPSAKRFKTLTKKFKEKDIESLDLREYIASEDDDDDIDIEEYKKLLRGKEENTETFKSKEGTIGAKIGNYTISFGASHDIPDLEEPTNLSGPKERVKQRKTESAKRKSKKSAITDDAEVDDDRDFDARLSREQQPGFDGNLEDNRFRRVLQDPDFAIDTRHPKYRVGLYAFVFNALPEHRFQQESSAKEGRIKTLITMLNINLELLRRFLLAGASSEASAELLRNVTIEEIVLNLSQLGDECFPSSIDEDVSFSAAIDDRYPGAILVRVLDELLDVSRLDALLNNPEVLHLLSERLLTGSLPVRMLFAKKCKLYFSKEARSNTKLEDLLWRLLFDQEYRVFEYASQAICSIVERDTQFLTPSRLDELAVALKNGDSDGIIAVRIIEFSAALGNISPTAFRILLDAGLYNAMFGVYMSDDCLVMLNCLEIMERMPTFVSRLQQASAIPREFINHAMSTISPDGSHGVGDELVAPFLFKFFLFLLHHPGTLTPGDSAAFGGVVSHVILTGNPKSAPGIHLSALECFGPLYVSGHISPEVCEKVATIVKTTTHDSAILAVVVSLMHMCDTPLDAPQSTVFHQLAKCIITALPRFPLSEVREQVYLFLLKALHHREVLQCVLEEENRSHLFSGEETLYATTVAKKQLVRLILSLMDTNGAQSGLTLPPDRINALRRYVYN
ncbi:Vir superfamily protein [Babesia ovis]|uniref:Vir superfamily protein n=1 Tax=Babesia ovis TaxID=5869 RepID=A0A9W5T7U4_BABOV|nr:Vir superfamily protein [Babesia ovis]